MKRFIQRLAIGGLAALVLVLGGCDLTELNEDPNNPTDATTPKLLTNAQTDLADNFWIDYAGGFWIRYAQYWTTNQYTEADRFAYPSRRQGSNNARWGTFYLVLNDLQEIKRINRQSPDAASAFGPNDNQIAVAHILQAWTYQVMTDLWGPIPFDAALKGRTEGDFSPEYTGQQEIYPALIDSLTAASNMIDTGSSAMASGDLMYGGDMSKWKKFANALKMRIAMRMSDQMPDAAATAIDEAVQAGAFASNADNALQPFNASPPYQNPFYEQYEVSGRDDWTIPESILSVMNGTEDPRRAAYFTDANPDTPEAEYQGLHYGLPGGEAQSIFTSGDFSRPGLRVRQPDAPAIMMLYDEVLFIMAEAQLRSDMDVPSITQSGEQLYRDAIRASLNYWGVTSEDAISGFLAGLTMPSDGDFDLAQDLGVQKWIAQYMQGIQGWSTWRRMDFTGVLQVPPGDPGQDLFGQSYPVRMTYPTDEATLNEENLQAAISNLLSGGEDSQGVLLWWDTEYVDPE